MKNVSFLSGSNKGLLPVNVLAIYSFGDEAFRPLTLTEKESISLNSVIDFELVLALWRKDEKERLLVQQILSRIAKKQDVLGMQKCRDGICMIGHSQIDQWSIESLNGRTVYNAGISGISSFEYNTYILEQNRLSVGCDYYIVMHGTNDIVGRHTLSEIGVSILKTIDYIYRGNPNARILFLGCAHVNGRLDRNNRDIDKFNSFIKEVLPDRVQYLNMDFLDDCFGNISAENTKDGLHFNEKAYAQIVDKVCTVLKEWDSE